MKKKRSNSITTRAIHGNKLYARTGPIAFPIYQTSTYRFENSNHAVRFAEGDESVYVYTRYHNPTVREVEEKIALMEEAESAILFSSGMAAISTTILSICKSGDEIVSTSALYGGTYRFFRDSLVNYNINVRYVESHSLNDLIYLINPRTRIVYLESPTNPTLDIVDLHKLVELTRKIEKEYKTKITIISDNTFATIINQKPFDFGVDIIIESVTKYLGGHADIVGGVAIGKKKILKKIKALSKHLGGCADPFAAFLLDRSLKTFELRAERQNDNAMKLAKFLSKHKNVLKVIYPGLPSHPQHQIAKKQMSGFGAMITIEVKNGLKGAVKVCDKLKIAINAMSLGGVETLVSIPVYSSHINLSESELARQGVAPGMVRISVGIEGIDDLVSDFTQALNSI